MLNPDADSKLTNIALLIVLLSLAGCASGDQKPMTGEANTSCVDPRPQICTADYRPVCAELENGELKTYANACSACADVNVVAHIPDACE